MDTIRKKYPEFKSTDFLEKLLGTDAFNAPDFDCESFIETQRKKIEQYLIKAQKYYLYWNVIATNAFFVVVLYQKPPIIESVAFFIASSGFV